MTRHKHAQTGLVTPPLPQLWLTATLRAFAMLVHLVAALFQMVRSRTSVNATRATPPNLPRETSDTQSRETELAVQPDSLQSADAEQRSFAARPSKHERDITAANSLTTCHPGSTKCYPGTIVRARQRLKGSRRSLRSAGMTVVGLIGQPCGCAHANAPAPNKNAPA
jgi:hypothetical protein